MVKIKSDALVPILFLVLAIPYTITSFFYGIKMQPVPEAGFVPMLLGIALIGMSVIQIVFSLRSKDCAAHDEEEVILNKLLQCIGIVLFYTVAFNSLGFPISTGVAVYSLARIMGLEGWIKPLVLSIGAVLAANYLFAGLLGIPLPGSLF